MNNLPLQTTSFVGRDHEIAEVRRLLASARTVTLTGVGGGGKTRLALQVAAGLVDDFPDGVWFVEVSSLSHPSLVAQTVATVLGVAEESGRSLLESLIAFAESKRLLLILDNCEHVVAATAHLASTLLRACPSLRILATSSEPLVTAREATFRRDCRRTRSVRHTSRWRRANCA